MTETTRRIIKCLLIAVALITIDFGCDMFPESMFELPKESRLPKWVQLPPGLQRSDVSLTMIYPSKFWGSYAEFILRDKDGRKLKKYGGSLKCNVPPSVTTEPGYPDCIAMSVNGITDIIEHRKMKPVFYVSDNPDVWELYESMKCR
jgi:hypothetical protein